MFSFPPNTLLIMRNGKEGEVESKKDAKEGGTGKNVE
jgi:hypothetical protein